jgi:translation initiation factor IF-2
VHNGQECGIRPDNFANFQEGDVIEAYTVEKIAQKL